MEKLQRIDLDMIGKEQPKRCLKRWRDSYERFREGRFPYRIQRQREYRGPSSKHLSAEEKLRKAEARI